MNTGIADVHNLAYKIADAEYNYNKNVLKNYEKERRYISSLTAKYSHQNFNKGEKIVNKLNVDLQTFRSFSSTLNTLTSPLPSSFKKSLMKFTISTAQKISMNPYFLSKKRSYLETYSNGIALLFPNLDYSYTYPIGNTTADPSFLDANYDNREYILVNSPGSLLPLFNFFSETEGQVYPSRQFVWEFQAKQKRPFYFVFVFGDGEGKEVDWEVGDTEMAYRVMNSEKIYMHVERVKRVQIDQDDKIKPEQAVFKVQEKILGLGESRPG